MIYFIDIFTKYFFNFAIIFMLFYSVKFVYSEQFEQSRGNVINVRRQFKIIIAMLVASGFAFMFYKVPIEVSYHFASVIGVFFFIRFVFKFFYKGYCPLLLNVVLFLLATSLIMLYRLDVDLAISQLKWIVLGFTATIFLPKILDFIPEIDKYTYVYFAFTLIFLLLPTFFAEEIYGARNWVTLFGVSFQPSEFAKFFFLFYLASFFRNEMTVKKIAFVILSGVSFVLILASQNDFGGVLIFFMTFMVLTYVATGSKTIFSAGLISASLLSVIAYHFVRHIQTRVAIWQNPWDTPYTSGSQIIQSLFAMGSYAPFGSGLNNGYPYYVYVVESDFIFAGISEELGGIFAICLIGVYLLLFYRGTHIALRSSDRFYSLCAVGITSMLAFQTFVIIGGVSKFIPLTGVTMPFVSYGGTSLVTTIMLYGILQYIYIKTKTYDDDYGTRKMPWANEKQLKKLKKKSIKKDKKNKKKEAKANNKTNKKQVREKNTTNKDNSFEYMPFENTNVNKQNEARNANNFEQRPFDTYKNEKIKEKDIANNLKSVARTSKGYVEYDNQQAVKGLFENVNKERSNSSTKENQDYEK